MTLPVLTYFSSRGRAEMIRLVCAEADVAYEERLLGVYDPVRKTPAFDGLKATGKLPFDAVPLWEEPGGLALAQSDAIVRHLARTRGLYGRDAAEAARCDMIFAGVDDVRTEVRRMVTTDAARRPALRASLAGSVLPRWVGHFERLLVANRGGDGFIVGEHVSFADVALFTLFENLKDNRFVAAYSDAPRLAAHGKRMEARPGIARYIASPSRFPAQILPG
jgi:glutathione S-transferase